MLSSKQVLQEKNTNDPNAITALTLTHKALSDVSCLSDFKNLERLDLSFNNLSSLEDLKNCVNLKWLSVVHNKLQILKGVEGLTKLTVLNAGKNKLRSMDEVRSLVSLRALILNDNDIVSICRLDQMKELSTLVLSRNPVQEIGESLVKLKLITKLSLSNCQIQAIGSSLKSCTELKELRLAHNHIKILPGELDRNVKIMNLDLGNNFITMWSDVKVLASLVNLRNLNLQGNPIADKKKLANKIKNLLPNLQIYNARTMKSEKGKRGDDSSLDGGDKLAVQKGEQADGKKSSGHQAVVQNKDADLDNVENLDVEKKLKLKRKRRDVLLVEEASEHKEHSNDTIRETKVNKKLKAVKENESNAIDREKDLLQKKDKTNKRFKENGSNHKTNTAISEKEFGKKLKAAKQNVASIIDDGETPFFNLFAADSAEFANSSIERELNQDVNTIGDAMPLPIKKKKMKNQDVGSSALQSIIPAVEIGLGGPSAWDN